MKRILLILFVLLAATGCNLGNYSRSSGLQDQAYISLVAPKKGTALVSVDGAAPVAMTVVKARKGYNYAAKHRLLVGVGKHRVRIEQNGRVVFDRDIFVSTREVKQIEL